MSISLFSRGCTKEIYDFGAAAMLAILCAEVLNSSMVSFLPLNNKS